ncbi:MAG: class II fumarate hydratase [Lysobacterales bacterium]
MSVAYRIEQDSLGTMQVPADALWGAQTQRAVLNFPISRRPMPRAFIRALGLIKAAAAQANQELGHLPPALASAIIPAALAVASGAHDDAFPVDVFQTGSGTSSNMNANEVIATLATRGGTAVHPNDHVNMAQSSNDVVPSAIQLAATLLTAEQLLPALRELRAAIETRAREYATLAKTGRTHLMDAMPLTLGQELGCWAAQLHSAEARISDTLARVRSLPLGGTAIGTGINADPAFGERACAILGTLSGVELLAASNRFEGIAAKDECVELSGQLKTLACALMKIANDLRWMNSGPLAGLGEIELPTLQPGSSIMPGKVNPVIPEAVCMVAAQVIGNDAAITIAGQSGNFQLNVMLPLIARNLLESLELLSRAMTLLASRCIAGFVVRQAQIDQALARNPILVTALNAVIGYELGAATAKRAYAEQRPILEVAQEMTGLPEAELRRLLDPLALTTGGVREGVTGGG